ncbi:MAG: response regulator [Xanthomonadaceae bacterium]|nr:response regulator [Xanthomonadaceae bacterium]
MIKVLLVDDHRLIRASLRQVLDSAPGIIVVGEAATGEDALAAVATLTPDVVLMDVQMPGMGGLEATRKLRAAAPAARVIVLSVHADDPYPSKLLEAGAAGYLTKDCEPAEMVDAVRRVASGEIWIEARVARRLAQGALAGRTAAAPLAELSRRELQVMTMVASGQDTQAIAASLQISPKTVATYRYRLYEKLGVANDVELARLAMRHELVG